MKQMETTIETIGEYTFYLKPFPAFVASNISGELASVLTPILSSIAPAFADKNQDKNILDMDVSEIVPAVSGSISSISGDKVEKMIRKLIVDYRNISFVETEDSNSTAKILTFDIANEIFCGNVEDMYILCAKVIKLNFSGFFKKLGILSGNHQEEEAQMTNPSSNDTEN